TRAAVVRVALLCAGMAAVTAALAGLTAHRPPLADSLGLPWWSLALLFLVTSRVQIHVEVRRSAHSVTLTDLAVVLALFSVAPGYVPLLRAVTWVPICAWRYRHSLRRAFFNGVLGPLETAVATLVFTTLGQGALLREPRAWSAAYAGILLAGFAGALLVTAVIALNDGHASPAGLREAAALGVVVGAANCTLGVIAVLLVDTSPAARWLLLALAGVLVVGYHSYATLRERHRGLESLFGFTRSLARRPESEDAVPALLRLAADRLAADSAELLLASWPGEVGPVLLSDTGGGVEARPAALEDHWPLARVLAEQTPMILSDRSRDEAVRRYLARVGHREMLLAPLPSDDAPLGVLVVCDRTAASVRGFTDDDLRLLETMATHGGAELANARLVDRLRHDASHDALTGLRNRSVLPEAVARLVTPAASQGTCVGAVVLLDLDDFKQVNDALGHHVGDLLLQHVAGRLHRARIPGAEVCRLGGDEFALVLPGDEPSLLLALVGTVKEELARPVDLGPVTVSSGASVGVAFVGPHGVTAPVLLQRADVAMYAAKRTNRGVVAFDNTIDSVRPERLGLASDLRALLSGDTTRGTLDVHYQPQVALSGAVVAVEALVRWTHPSLGLLPPDEFVQVAESTGLAGRLTDTVLRTALADLTALDDLGFAGLCVSVNLSARSLHDAGLVEDVTAALNDHGIAPGRLTLELTESSIVSDPVRASELLGLLAARGVRVSVDDFGTGYSSLSHLARLPVSEVKVDKSFVRRMREDARDAAIVRSVVRLAAELDNAVVAEGVEDEETARELQALGCDLIQGYLYSRPLPLPLLVEWLASRQTPVPIRLRDVV
ncbi:MAG TPA: EAL domain-containing protein, partial [Mycobacteriales bacterium]|nr:EAL domain-containing protein [Mycobacteriales bacterium]